MVGGDGVHDAQAQAGAGDGESLRVGSAMKAVEHLGLLGFGDPDPSVSDGQPRAIVVALEAYVDAPAVLGELDRVGEQVQGHPLKLYGIALDPDRPRGELGGQLENPSATNGATESTARCRQLLTLTPARSREKVPASMLENVSRSSIRFNK